MSANSLGERKLSLQTRQPIWSILSMNKVLQLSPKKSTDARVLLKISTNAETCATTIAQARGWTQPISAAYCSVSNMSRSRSLPDISVPPGPVEIVDGSLIWMVRLSVRSWLSLGKTIPPDRDYSMSSLQPVATVSAAG